MPEAKSERNKPIFRSQEEWTKIRDEYLAGGISLAELGCKHGISSATLKAKSAREGWSSGITSVALNHLALHLQHQLPWYVTADQPTDHTHQQ